jgi:hypothetical protein
MSPVGSPRTRIAGVLAALVVLGAVAAAPASSAPSSATKAEICGIPPGDGAYSYVKVWNIRCARANNVASKAIDRYCDESGECDSIDPAGGFVKGPVSFNGWDCKVKLAYEFARVVCEKPGKRLVQESGA